MVGQGGGLPLNLLREMRLQPEFLKNAKKLGMRLVGPAEPCGDLTGERLMPVPPLVELDDDLYPGAGMGLKADFDGSATDISRLNLGSSAATMKLRPERLRSPTIEERPLSSTRSTRPTL